MNCFKDLDIIWEDSNIGTERKKKVIILNKKEKKKDTKSTSFN